MKKITSTSLLLVLLTTLALGSCEQKKETDNVQPKSSKPNLAPTPPMGWNSWNWFGKHDINETVVRETIDAMVENGLRDAGYNYVVVDGGWRDTVLTKEGKLRAHPIKFPNGIKALADYAHSKGMKFGVHVVPGSHDCGMDPVGGFGNEEVHVKQFVDWGLDFIKLDLCRNPDSDPCQNCTPYRFGWSEESIEATYKKWGKLLAESGRDILYSISAYTYRDWYPETCHMARTTGDIECKIHKGAFFNRDTIDHKHISVMEVAQVNEHAAPKAGNGYWNDPDMMVTGDHGLSNKEQESHFALWCMMSSPLFIGSDPRNMSDFEKNLLLNKEMIAINQDSKEQGRIIKRDEKSQVWLKTLKDGKKALLFVNLDTRTKKYISLDLSKIGVQGPVQLRDVLNKEDMGSVEKTIVTELDTHQSKFLLLSPQ